MARSNTGSTSNRFTHTGTFTTTTLATIACWLRPANLTSNMNLVFQTDAGFGNYIGLIYDGANLNGAGDNVFLAESCQSGPGDVRAASPTGGTAGAWMHGAAVFNGAASRTAYLNGVAGTPNTASRTPAAASVVHIASLSTFSPLNGDIAEIGIWNVALTTAEIASLAKGISPLLIRPNNLMAYYPLWGRGTETNLITRVSLTTVGTMAQAAHSPVFMPSAPLVGFAGAGSSTTAISGALMTRSKTFPAGVVSNTLGIAGALVTRGKTFPAGTVANTLNLAGALYTRPHTFPAGVVGLGTLGVGGALYTRPHTFPAGTIVTGSEILGALYTRPHTFPAGTLSLSLGLGGTLYTRPHTFPAGAVSLGTLGVGGALYTRPHTFFGGALNGSLGIAGALLTRGKTFPAGAITLGVVNIGGALYTRPKTFFSGELTGGDPPVSGGEDEVGGVYMIRRRRRGPR